MEKGLELKEFEARTYQHIPHYLYKFPTEAPEIAARLREIFELYYNLGDQYNNTFEAGTQQRFYDNFVDIFSRNMPESEWQRLYKEYDTGYSTFMSKQSADIERERRRIGEHLRSKGRYWRDNGTHGQFH